MKVLLVCTYDTRGGAAIATKRLLKALNQQKNIEAKLLVQEKFSQNENIYSTTNSTLKKYINKFRFFADVLWLPIRKKELRFSFSTARRGESLKNHKLVKQADIIHLSWVNNSFLSLKDIAELMQEKPVFWTLHDMWAFTGGCFHNRTCNQYKSICKDCHYLKKGSKIANKVFEKKSKLFSNKEINVICCSNWLVSKTKESRLFGNKRIIAIPNPINTTIFAPKDKHATRKKLGLDKQKIYIGFVAFNTTNKYKGAEYIRDTLIILQKKRPDLIGKLEILIIGPQKDKNYFQTSFKVNSVGHISSPELMSDYYNSMNLFMLPSLEENLPNTIMEAMACGIPALAFDVGGIYDLIEHKKNGYLAQFRNKEDLYKGIDFILANSDLYKELSENARNKVLENFSEQVVAKKYINFYNSTLSNKI